VAILLAAVSAGRGQSCKLAEVVQPGDCFRYQIDMKLAGQMKVNKEDKVVPIKLAAAAGHSFPERVLAVAANGTVEKSARLYEKASAVISAGEGRSERTLRPQRRLIVAQRYKDQALVYCPLGALYQPELELTSEHFDTLALPGLLPGKVVKVGETWKLANGVAQALCSFEGMTEQKLVGKLEKVAADAATFSIKGTAAGIELGALVKLKIDATGTFDLKAKRLTALQWQQNDDRDQGPASPAASTEVTVKLSRQAIAQPTGLSDVALISVPRDATPPGPMTNVEYRDPKERFALLHTRDWHLVGATDEHVVLRLMDRGDFVAQLTVTPWTKAKKGEHLSAEEFKKAMYSTSGWRPEREVQAGEVPGEGKWIYRISAEGQLDGVRVLQNFYLVAGPDGEQVVLTFTLSPKQADKLGARDLSLAASVEVPAKK
jgi:hypothetical protein